MLLCSISYCLSCLILCFEYFYSDINIPDVWSHRRNNKATFWLHNTVPPPKPSHYIIILDPVISQRSQILPLLLHLVTVLLLETSSHQVLDNTLSTKSPPYSSYTLYRQKIFFSIIYCCKQIVIDKGYNILAIHIMLIVLKDIPVEVIALIHCSMPRM